MAKDKQLIGHNQGMAYAYKIITECEPGKEREALAKEIKMRGLTNVPITVPKRIIDDAVAQIKVNTLQTVLVMLVAVLHDEFGFGQKRCQQAIDRFNAKAECLADDYCDWQDYIDVIKEELGITLSIDNLAERDGKNVVI